MRISAYETADGRIFKDRGKAKAHEAWLALRDAAKDAFVEIGVSMGDLDQDATELAQYLIDHRTELMPLMRKAACTTGSAPGADATAEMPPAERRERAPGASDE